MQNDLRIRECWTYAAEENLVITPPRTLVGPVSQGTSGTKYLWKKISFASVAPVLKQKQCHKFWDMTIDIIMLEYM